MGIDIYMSWRGITKAEVKEQFGGFQIDKGKYGYLREAYHGSPYPSHVLVPESFAWTENYELCSCEDADFKMETMYSRDHYCDWHLGCPIPAEVLEERLPGVIRLAIEREQDLYHNVITEEEYPAKSYKEFVALARAKQDELGSPVRIYASY